jgi:(heptosyl)LPS beta-1,4-glucosyltransferase
VSPHSRILRREEKLLLLAVTLFALSAAWYFAPGEAFGALPLRGAAAGCGTALLLLVPAARFLQALRLPYAPLRRSATGGLLLVIAAAGWAVLAGPPATTRLAGLALYLPALVALYAWLRLQEQAHYRRPVKRKQRLSVTVIARDEADRITRCLQSVHGWADEIVVLDSGSTDETVELARRYADHLEVTDWPGYGPQKQRALERATGDWVLSIDADEAVTPELRHDIDAALGERPACVAYKLPWGVVVYGKLLDFGQSARAPLRLFRREGSRFTEAQVHETVVHPPGAVGTLRGRLLHYTQRDFGHALRKVAHYGWLGARKRHAAGKRGGGAFVAALRALWVFLQIYVVRLGFLDGQPGFVTAVLYMQVSFDKYAGLWALRREERMPPREAARETAADPRATGRSARTRPPAPRSAPPGPPSS